MRLDVCDRCATVQVDGEVLFVTAQHPVGVCYPCLDDEVPADVWALEYVRIRPVEKPSQGHPAARGGSIWEKRRR